MRMMYYSVNDTGILGKKEIRVLLSPITSSDALPLSYRRLVGAKLGSWDKICILLGFECQCVAYAQWK